MLQDTEKFRYFIYTHLENRAPITILQLTLLAKYAHAVLRVIWIGIIKTAATNQFPIHVSYQVKKTCVKTRRIEVEGEQPPVPSPAPQTTSGGYDDVEEER